MAKPVTAQMFATVPSGDDDHMALQLCPLQHSQEDHTRPCLSVIALERGAIGQQNTPCVMGRLGIGLVTFERFEGGINLCAAVHSGPRDRVF